MRKMLTLRFDEDLLARVDKLAAELNKQHVGQVFSRTALIQDLVRDALDARKSKGRRDGQ